MVSYPLTDVNGTRIGAITLKDDELPNLIMNDVDISLGGSFDPNSKTFLSFLLVPSPIKERYGFSRSGV